MKDMSEVEALCGDFSSMRETWKEEIKNSILEMQERQEEEQQQQSGMEEEHWICLLECEGENKHNKQGYYSAGHFASLPPSLRALGTPKQRRRTCQPEQ